MSGPYDDSFEKLTLEADGWRCKYNVMYSAGHSQLDIHVRGTRMYCGVLTRVKLHALDTVPRAPLNVVHARTAHALTYTYTYVCTRRGAWCTSTINLMYTYMYVHIRIRTRQTRVKN